jgi:hypothetical protein
MFVRLDVMSCRDLTWRKDLSNVILAKFHLSNQIVPGKTCAIRQGRPVCVGKLAPDEYNAHD